MPYRNTFLTITQSHIRATCKLQSVGSAHIAHILICVVLSRHVATSRLIAWFVTYVAYVPHSCLESSIQTFPVCPSRYAVVLTCYITYWLCSSDPTLTITHTHIGTTWILSVVYLINITIATKCISVCARIAWCVLNVIQIPKKRSSYAVLSLRITLWAFPQSLRLVKYIILTLISSDSALSVCKTHIGRAWILSVVSTLTAFSKAALAHNPIGVSVSRYVSRCHPRSRCSWIVLYPIGLL